MGRRGMFSLCNFGRPYSRGVVASVIFSLNLASFVILLDSSKLFMKQTIRNEWKQEKTKARKHDHSWRPQKFFQVGNVDILFVIFKLLTISIPS